MAARSRGTVTELLIAWRNGNRDALGELVPAVQDELHRIAQRLLRRDRTGHTLQTTALVNEAYLRLINKNQVDWRDRAHFVGIAAHLMRQILVDYGRRVHRKKRSSNRIDIDENLLMSPEKSTELLALDDALCRLAEFDSRKARIVELRFFAGLSVKETAEVLQVHENTIIRDWAFAKAWLRKDMESSV